MASPSDITYLRGLVYERSAIVIDSNKEYLIEARLGPLAREVGLGSTGALIKRLRSDQVSALHTQVMEAMLTNETQFFRDGHPFDALRVAVVPELMSRGSVRPLCFWSAACSTGQEPYSTAMLLHEHFPELSRWRARILASDLCGNALKRAKEGRYSQVEVKRGLPPRMLNAHFAADGAAWQLKDRIRHRVEFQQLNLIGSWPNLGPVDVVFLRNVLIYFDLDTRRSLLARVRRILGPDGYLFVGATETLIDVDDSFEAVPFDRGVYYRLRA